MNTTILNNHRITGLLTISIATALLALSPSCYALTSSIRYQKRWVGGLPAHVVTINLNDPDVQVSSVLPRYGVGRSESWQNLVGRARPTAAITGTYFHTRTYYPTGDIVIDGDLKCEGRVGTALCIGWNNKATMIPTKRGCARDWSCYRTVLVGGPVVVWDGQISVNPREQGFRDSRLFARKARTAVGVTKGGKLLMVAVTKPVYLRSLGKVMKGLGCSRAAALDGGGSTALYYRGKSLAKPSRRLTNLLVAYDTSAAHERVRNVLAPRSGQWAQLPGSFTR